MKRKFVALFVLLPLLLTACVNESPEPLVTLEETKTEERVLVSGDESGGIQFAVYSDDTCEILGLTSEFTDHVFEVPAYFDELPVVAIADNAFRDTSLLHVTLPETIERIGDRAFQRCHIESLVMPDSVVSIGEDSFDNCLKMKTLTLSRSLKEIPMGAFYSCSSLETVVVPEGVVSIGEEAFASCGALRQITLPSTLKEIGPWAFWNTGTAELSFAVPQSVETVGAHAFRETDWLAAQTEEFVLVGKGVLLDYNGTASSVTLPATVRYLSNAFVYSTATALEVPATLEGVCENALEDTAIVSVIYHGDKEEIKNRLK